MFKLLIVDDEEIERRAITHIVENVDIRINEILQASNGQEAVAVAAAAEPDIIIMDITMPGFVITSYSIHYTKLYEDNDLEIPVFVAPSSTTTITANFVRLSHYPHHPHFLDRCDEGGIYSWEEIPLYQAGLGIIKYYSIKSVITSYSIHYTKLYEIQ